MQIDDIIRQMLPEMAKHSDGMSMDYETSIRVTVRNQTLDACEAKLKAGLRIEGYAIKYLDTPIHEATIASSPEGSIHKFLLNQQIVYPEKQALGKWEFFKAKGYRVVILLEWEEKRLGG